MSQAGGHGERGARKPARPGRQSPLDSGLSALSAPCQRPVRDIAARKWELLGIPEISLGFDYDFARKLES